MEITAWLAQPPKYTTFRINRMKIFDIEVFKQFLEKQREDLHILEAPTFYCLTADCLVVEQWPVDVKPENNNSEVIVDAMCCSINDKVNIYGDLEGKCKKGLKVVYTGKKQFVGTGYLRMMRHELFNAGSPPSGLAVEVILPASRLPVVNESIYPKGTLLLQNLPSLVCGQVVNARPGELILDMCAAPGNKTTHLAEMSNNQAIIVAIDRTLQKVKKIQENCENHGVTCVRAYIFDSTKCYSSNGGSIDSGPPYKSNMFDKILLDGPCSGLGQRPQLINKMTPKMLQSYKFVQRKLFDAVSELNYFFKCCAA
ncbi:hypothetical protein MSG28_010259 [Choristoneura fumiferana]|uniref:Uncharacterized protein n=1 Tax=Choristoneura fumiferana TaxID=7141 RepID=A0ACC0KK39_CHOFU|nr:hypothetical protein MSG28_010259 [Choristoneura fumiferana]